MNEIENEDDVVYDDDTGATLVKKLREKIKTLEKEKQEYLDGWQRMKADVVNRDRQAAEDKLRIGLMVKEGMLEELLPVLDSFDAAFSGASWQNVDANWRTGIEYIHSQFKKILDENNVKAFGAVGDTFDPTLHDVSEEVPSEQAPGTVHKVLRTGYQLNGKVIRPARVQIAR